MRGFKLHNLNIMPGDRVVWVNDNIKTLPRIVPQDVKRFLGSVNSTVSKWFIISRKGRPMVFITLLERSMDYDSSQE